MSTQHLALVLFASGALTFGLLPAQSRTVVNPPANATAEGNSRITFPFGGTGTMRYQQILATSAIPQAAGTIQRIAFRRDNDSIVQSGNYTAWSPNIDLILSTSPRTPLTISPDYAKNHGNDVAKVFSGQLNWPAQAKNSPGPTPFAYTIPLQTPFPYVSVRGDLCVEIVHHSSNNTNSLCFMDADSSSGGSTSRTLGAGCPAGSNAVVVYSNWAPGAYSRILLWKATPNTFSIFSLASSSSTWLGIPLPFDLAPLGAPGCNLYQSNDVWVNGMTSSSGRWDLRFSMPNIPALGGATVYAQFLQLGDTGAGNAAQVSVSDGVAIQLATPTSGQPPQSEMHATNTGANTASLVQQGYGMVTEIGF